jgi:2-oxo-4-hydroxy-4-carboxy-5-ureidoimidazoline decarboxylase
VTVQEFNAAGEAEARAWLRAVCAAPRWAARVAAGRPYASAEALYAAAEQALTDADLDAAIADHPRIGDRSAGGAAGREQSGVRGADPAVLAALADANRAYEERFGHVYLVCASGRGAEDLLAILRGRLGNDAATERAVARRELVAINRIRLDGLLAEPLPAGGRS